LTESVRLVVVSINGDVIFIANRIMIRCDAFRTHQGVDHLFENLLNHWAIDLT